MKLIFLICICAAALNCNSASKILFLFPSFSKSHLIITQNFAQILAERGHEVTVVSPFSMNKKVENYREIISPLPHDALDFANSLMKSPSSFMLTKFPKVLSLAEESTKMMIEMPEFKKIVDEESFDLLFIGMFFSDSLLGYSHHFKCPSMMLSVNAAFTSINRMFGNPLEVNAVPHLMLRGEMNFLGRLKNFLMFSFESLTMMYLNYRQRKFYKENFPSDKFPSYDDALKNISMVLLNSHMNQGNIRPYVPSMVEVGGLQIKPKPDPLPSDLAKFLDEAPNGAILFSFGTNAKPTFLPEDKIQILMNVFSKLQQRIIVKWDSDKIENKPENVLIKTWLPQDDILAHRNVKLFISHGGLGGIAESKFHAVPIVGIPIFGDQDGNLKVVVSEGWGIKLDLLSLTEQNLSDGIREVLYNSSYSSTVKRLSELYRDRPLSARETAIYWVEYVIRHRGAPHLHYNGADQNLFQSTSLDVISFIALVTYLTYKVVKIIILKLCCGCCGRSAATKKVKFN